MRASVTRAAEIFDRGPSTVEAIASLQEAEIIWITPASAQGFWVGVVSSIYPSPAVFPTPDPGVCPPDSKFDAIEASDIEAAPASRFVDLAAPRTHVDRDPAGGVRAELSAFGPHDQLRHSAPPVFALRLSDV